MKTKIDFNNYEPIDKLDKEEQELWNDMQNGDYQSIMTSKVKDFYSTTFIKSAKRDQSSNVRLTSSDKILAKARAKEEGIPYQVLLSSIVHKFLHGKLKEVL